MLEVIKQTFTEDAVGTRGATKQKRGESGPSSERDQMSPKQMFTGDMQKRKRAAGRRSGGSWTGTSRSLRRLQCSAAKYHV